MEEVRAKGTGNHNHDSTGSENRVAARRCSHCGHPILQRNGNSPMLLCPGCGSDIAEQAGKGAWADHATFKMMRAILRGRFLRDLQCEQAARAVKSPLLNEELAAR
jgi:ribosomal protein L37AE/L43A